MSRIFRPHSRARRSSSVYSNDGSSIFSSNTNGTYGGGTGSGYIGGGRNDVYFQSPVSLVYREALRDGDSFSPYASQSLINEHHRKRQSRSSIYMLNDRFKIEKRHGIGREPFRNELTYAEIVDSETGANKPEYVLLSIATSRGMRYYEIYKFPAPGTASDFNRVVQKAIHDPERRLRDEVRLREKKFSHNFGRSRSIASLGPSEYDEVGSRLSMMSDEYSVAPSIGSSSWVQHQQPSYSQPLFSSAATPTRFGHNGVTYISYHPRDGPTESEVGPVYLFSSDNADEPLHVLNHFSDHATHNSLISNYR